jgi:hypothetical protein
MVEVGGEMGKVRAVLTDVQFWVPVVVLGVGIWLLAVLR